MMSGTLPVRTLLFLLALPLLSPSGHAARAHEYRQDGLQSRSAENRQQTHLQGTVSGPGGEPLSLVNVYLQRSGAGDATDREGRFSIRTRATGPDTLVVSMIGFRTHREPLELAPGEERTFAIRLREALTELDAATVSASSFTTGDVEGVTLSPLEVVTTPGAAADIFRAFQSFPGVASVDEGSGLFVRGGDATETKVLLDQSTIVHPYKYETPTGGVFGTIPPFLVSGTFFSTGGFPARYGNALSGVLSMQSRGMPESAAAEANLGLAAASAGFSAALLPEKLGVRFSGNRSFTGAMFAVNGLENEFEEPPASTDLNLSVIYKPGPASTVKAFSYVTDNRVGVPVEEASFEEIYRGKERNRLYNLQWTRLFGGWLMRTSLSTNRFENSSDFGALQLEEADRTWKLRTDWEGEISESVTLYTGAEAVRRENRFSGTIPQFDEVSDPESPVDRIDESYGTTRIGLYAEADIRLAYRLTGNAGVRSDYHRLSRSAVLDPRFSLRYRIGNRTTLRLAAGLYHQFPEPFHYIEETGNTGLAPQHATHYIAGFEHQADKLHLRVEGYYKDYDALVVPDNGENYSNRGHGSARGVDLFLRYSEFLESRFNGWVSYSYLESDRFQAVQHGEEYRFGKGPSDYDITHNLNIVGKVQLVDMLYLGAAYRYATGRPHTPVTGALQPSGQSWYLPVEGAPNSERLPDFNRLDLNLSYHLPLPRNQSVTFYSSVSNVLNRQNVNDYRYNHDYSNRTPVYSSYKRFFYAGVTATLNLNPQSP